MKIYFKFVPVLATSIFLLSACGGNKSNDSGESTTEESGGISDVISGVKNLDNLKDGANKMEEMQGKLKGLTSLTNDELKAFFPETLEGLKRTSISVGNNEMFGNVATGNATYADENGKEITVKLMDGAGELGSGIISLIAMGYQMDNESESGNRVEKTHEFNGKRAKTEEVKENDGTQDYYTSAIGFIEKDRYSVELRGQHFSLSELQKGMDKLNYGALK
ncbi:hypothetical protein [Sphingobacterium sp. SYP-B4668]|uniref:hypothetical protein n=1 Tax=Sphingobacterium sp. SYP-B4668 TaxID=2996035 RepID=UPI0022DE80E4|nr:hypothetical protein [Sphingobacterium sp. SYP-B4668]